MLPVTWVMICTGCTLLAAVIAGVIMQDIVPGITLWPLLILAAVLTGMTGQTVFCVLFMLITACTSVACVGPDEIYAKAILVVVSSEAFIIMMVTCVSLMVHHPISRNAVHWAKGSIIIGTCLIALMTGHATMESMWILTHWAWSMHMIHATFREWDPSIKAWRISPTDTTDERGMVGLLDHRMNLGRRKQRDDDWCTISVMPCRWYAARGLIQQRPASDRDGSIISDWLTPLTILRNSGPDAMVDDLYQSVHAWHKGMDHLLTSLALHSDDGWEVTQSLLEQGVPPQVMPAMINRLVDGLTHQSHLTDHHHAIIRWLMTHAMHHDPIRIAVLGVRSDQEQIERSAG
jgi:hypothetical protein